MAFVVPSDCVGVADSAARMPSRRLEQVVGAVVFRADRDADQGVVAGDALLRDLLDLARDAGAAAPMVGEFAVQQHVPEDRLLIIGIERLLYRAEIELQRLIARQEIRLDELAGQVVARLGLGAAAARKSGADIELLGIAEQVAVRPGRDGVNSEVGRVRGAERDGVLRPLRDLEGDRQGAS